MIFIAIDHVKLKHLKKQNSAHENLIMVWTNMIPEVQIRSRLAQSIAIGAVVQSTANLARNIRESPSSY